MSSNTADEKSGSVGFAMEKIYVRDVSVEVPHAPHIFLERETPTVEVEFSNGSEKMDDHLYSCVIAVTVTATLKEKKQVMFIVEVKQAGVFQLKNIPKEYFESVLNVDCCNILYPYLREAVSDLVVRAGFPPVYLSPLNFQALYEQKKVNAVKSA